MSEKSPGEICRDCKYRHPACQSGCKVYEDILREKREKRNRRRGNSAEQYTVETMAARAGRQI